MVDDSFPGGPPSPHPGVAGPLGVGQTVGQAFRLYGSDLLQLWGAVALVLVPVGVISFILRDVALPADAAYHSGKLYVPYGTSIGGYTAANLLDDLLTLIASLLTTGAVYRLLLGRYLHHPADLRTSFSFARQRAGKLFGVAVLTVIALVVGFICIIIPGIYLLVVLSLGIPVAMAENLGIVGSLDRSMRLVRGHWWHVFAIALLEAIVVVVFEVVVSLVLAKGIVGSTAAPSLYFLIIGIVNLIVGIVIAPFIAAVSVVLYVDMLLRTQDPQLPALLA